MFPNLDVLRSTVTRLAKLSHTVRVAWAMPTHRDDERLNATEDENSQY